jgi:methyl-accepting chemotaxis protein
LFRRQFQNSPTWEPDGETDSFIKWPAESAGAAAMEGWTAMKDWTINRKLTVGIGTLVVALLAAGGLGLWNNAHMKDELDEVVDSTARKLDLAHDIYEEATLLRAEQRGVLIAGFTKNIAEQKRAAHLITGATASLRAHLEQIAPLIYLPEGKQRLEEIRNGVRDWEKVNGEMERLVAEAKIEEAERLERQQAVPLIDAVGHASERLVKIQQALLRDSQSQIAFANTRAWWTLFAIVVASAIVASIVAWVVRSISRVLATSVSELSEGAQQVAAASSQVSSSAQSLSQGATQQAASLEETSASMEELSSMTRQNADNSQEAARVMAETATLIQGANVALGDMVSSMAAIKDSSDRVAKIIKTIDEIAFQTNILALNAAVEAARAGEAGMGFAVVADEVRALAQRSAQAAKDTAALIDESIARSTEGQQKVRQASAAIESITESSVRVKSLVDEVSLASGQQSQGIGQVSQAVAQMEKVTQSTAATAEESAAASEELNAQAETSMQVVRELTRLVHGAAAGGMVSHAPAAKVPAGRGRTVSPRASVVTFAKVAAGSREASHEAEDVQPGTGTFGEF